MEVILLVCTVLVIFRNVHETTPGFEYMDPEQTTSHRGSNPRLDLIPTPPVPYNMPLSLLGHPSTSSNVLRLPQISNLYCVLRCPFHPFFHICRFRNGLAVRARFFWSQGAWRQVGRQRIGLGWCSGVNVE